MKYSTRKIDTDADFSGYNADNFCHVGAAVIGGSVISGIMGSNAASSAASGQAAAGQAASAASLQATRETNAMQQKMYDENVARQSPWVDQGKTSLTQLGGLMAPGGQLTQTFKPSDLTTDPSYQWRLNQGSQALNASAAARGMLGSGQNLKDMTNYAQGAASQEYGAAFDRYNTNQNNLFNRLSSLSGLGQNAAAGVGNQGTQVANSMSQNTMAGTAASNNYLTGAAASNAAGQVGQANAIGGAIQGGMSNWMGNQQLQNQQNYLSNMSGASAPAAANFMGGGTSTPWSVAPPPATGALGSGTYGI